MTILDDYLGLAKAERWHEALLLIEEIVRLGPEIATSRFNYGVCLEALGRHHEAAQQFLEAYRLEPENYRAQYRIFRSLWLGEDWQGFLSFAQQECEAMPEMVDILFGDKDFTTVLARSEFADFRKRYGQ